VLAGSDRQVAWATTIRASRLATMIADHEAAAGWQACLLRPTQNGGSITVNCRMPICWPWLPLPRRE